MQRTLTGYIREKFGNDEAEKLYLGRPNRVTLSVVYYPDINDTGECVHFGS